MDRAAVYLGQVPRSLDILSQGQNAMVGLAKLSEAILGTSTVVTGFPITATATPSLNINVGAGQVYQVEALESTQLSGLAPDVHQIVKQGLNLDPTTLTLIPPTSAGNAVNVLIEVGYSDVDTGAIVLTFQNPSAPGTTYQGPGGNGQASNTVRKGVAQVRPVYGTPTTAGQQTTPSPDVGFVGIAVVTLTYGQTSITSASVGPYNYNSNYIPSTLTGIPFNVQSGTWVVGQAMPAGPVIANSPTPAQIAAANTYATTLFSTAAYPFALTAGMEILAYFGQGNTSTTPVLNVNGTGNLPLLRQSGGAPAIANATGGTPPDVAGWVPLILNNSRTAWIINGLATSDVQNIITSTYIITTALTIQVGGTAPAASTTAYPNYFANLPAALAWVSQFRIAASGAVSFQLAAGQQTIASQFVGISHPDGARITIVGATMKAAAPTASNFQVTGYSASARANDKAANLAMCRARYGSEIVLTGGSSLVVTANFGGFFNVLISSDGTQNTGAGFVGDILAVQAGLVYATNCVFAGCASRGVVSTGAATTILGSCFAFGNAGNGFSAEGGGKIVGTTAAASFGNGGNGVFSSNGSLFGMDQSNPNSNLTAQGNGQNGALATSNGIISTVGPSANLSTNGGCGAFGYARGTVIADGSTAANNGAAAFNAAAGGYVSALNTSGSGNNPYGYNASGSSLIVATGGTASGTSGTFSPAANTVGNGNAYIYQ